MPPKRKAPKKGAKAKGRKRSSGASTAVRSNNVLAGTEDCEEITMAWETILSTTLAASTDFLACLGGNFIYQPGGITTYGYGLTTNPVGYARMYTQYRYAQVVASTLAVEVWATSGTITAGVPAGSQTGVPTRVVLCAASSQAAATYFGQTVATLAGCPHSKSTFQEPGARNRLSLTATPAQILTAGKQPTAAEFTLYSAETGAGPSSQYWFVLGVANASGVLNITNLEVRSRITYRVKWYSIKAQAPMLDRFGNEASAPSAPKSEYKTLHAAFSDQSTAESKGDAKRSVIAQADAFEDWSDADSEFASFKEQCALRRKAMRKAEAASAATETKVAGELRKSSKKDSSAA